MSDKHKLLKEVITYFCLDSLSEDKSSEVIDKLKEIYDDDNYRHRYSEITEAVLSNVRKDKDEDIVLMTITQNIRIIKEKIDQIKDLKNIVPHIEKLYDHINLECIRLRNSNERIKELNDDICKLEKTHTEIKNKLESTEKTLKQQQVQYITILGIFASIVITFTAGFGFSSAVFSKVGDTNPFILAFIMCFVAFFIGNILHFLFRFIKDINQIQRPGFWKQGIFWFNIVIVAFLIVLFVYTKSFYPFN